MHRTTTTATLLLSVAVSALSGCTTVQPASGPAAGARPAAPRADGPAEQGAVQAPAREALEMTGSSPSPGRASKKPHRTGRPATPAPRRPPAAAPQPPRPEVPWRPGGSAQRPRADVPDLPGPAGKGAGTNVCSLGRKYGGWRPGSPEATICEQTYGR
ncbi:hypothetical protein ACIRFH_17405 [Streptomyces sp. NPDC093586]|uniref:hypothetical protein n=1 Tax=Streptomyces sp. NPDC093586 TaxID=3366042 RepID=UPI003807D512